MTFFSIQVHGPLGPSCSWTSRQCPFSAGPRLCLGSLPPPQSQAALVAFLSFEYPKLVSSLEPLPPLCPLPGVLFPTNSPGPVGPSSPVTSAEKPSQPPLERSHPLPLVAAFHKCCGLTFLPVAPSEVIFVRVCVLSPLLDWTSHDNRGGVLSGSPLEQCLVHNRSSLNIG